MQESPCRPAHARPFVFERPGVQICEACDRPVTIDECRAAFRAIGVKDPTPAPPEVTS